MNAEDENIPMELVSAGGGGGGEAAVPPLPLAPLAPPLAQKRTIKPKAAAPPAPPPESNASEISRLISEMEDGKRKLKPEDLHNPFSKEFNKLLLKKELLERAYIVHDIGVLPGDGSASEDEGGGGGGGGGGGAAADAKHLYPTLNDPNFNTKIALRKEFFDTKMDVDNKASVEEQAEILCNAPFELAPNQQFVRNFLSVETPYNSLLLYHGLGTGKTCSAISVAEEMRDYMKQMGISQRIIVIASPNVQENFRLQLFDERELREIEPGVWNIRACTGNKFIKEVNPMNMKGLTRDKIVKHIEFAWSLVY
jgi:hypothetical protein